MKFSATLQHVAAPILKAQFDHPFVKGLGAGTLPLDKFRYYMIQDTLYIVEYARAMAWVAPRLRNVKDIIAMLEAAKQSFQVEAMLKEQYFTQFGITLEDALKTELAPTCQAYVDHLQRYSHGGTLAEGMAAILPCGWVYIEIGREFTTGAAIPDAHPYKSWLMTYAAPEFREMVAWWFNIFDDAVAGYPEHELQHIQEIFLKSCRYEWMFWELGWNKQEWKP